MAWVTPPTWSLGQIITSADLNRLRDDLLETAVAKATTAGTHFVATGVNAVAERFILDSIVETSETTTSTSYVDLATVGPSVTITTGAKALVWINASLSTTATTSSRASFGVTGATTSAAIDARAIENDIGVADAEIRAGVCSLQPALTAGSNIFTMQYRVASGTGTFARRRIQVMAL